jgi:hypothetical protein
MGRLGKRIGVSAYRCVGVCKASSTPSRPPGIIAVPKSSLTSPDADTPTRRPADTLPQPAAHFERNDITIICETVHKMMVSLWPTRQDSILLKKAGGFQIVSVIL